MTGEPAGVRSDQTKARTEPAEVRREPTEVPTQPAASIRVDAIVVAAGSSERMAGMDKLDHVVGGRPLLAYTLAAIAAAPEVERIVVVTGPDRVARVAAAEWLPPAVRAVVAGGARRHESVAAGLAGLESLDDSGRAADGDEAGDVAVNVAGDAADDVAPRSAPGGGRPAPPLQSMADRPDPGSRVVLVHDGARPLVDPGLVSRVAAAAALFGAAIPVLAVTDTLKRLDGDRLSGTVDRAGLAVAQTPQGVRRILLREAFERFPPEGPETWTDEAALLEACTIPVHAIPGDPTNLKVTLPGDLARVDAILSTTAVSIESLAMGFANSIGSRSAAGSAVHVGFGQDAHPFGPGTPLALGGVVIAGAPRLTGHSDGDVVLHAVAEAILGAARLGDLGRLFPAGPETPIGIASFELLAEVVRLAAAARFVTTGLDVAIVAARPRLAAWLPEMGRRIAELVGLSIEGVNVKASSGNLVGFEGAGRGISAQAVATLVRLPDSDL